MDTAAAKPFWMTLRTLWLSLTVSHVLLAGTLWFLRFAPKARPVVHESVDLFVLVFGPLAVAQGVISLWLPRWQLRQAARRLGV
ncbi:MAG: hypothetical protein EON47_23040, partial [Acetobacteraceae bacterium]